VFSGCGGPSQHQRERDAVRDLALARDNRESLEDCRELQIPDEGCVGSPFVFDHAKEIEPYVWLVQLALVDGIECFEVDDPLSPHPHVGLRGDLRGKDCVAHFAA